MYKVPGRLLKHSRHFCSTKCKLQLPKYSSSDQFKKSCRFPVENDKCWLWNGTINNNGYGMIYFQKRIGLAHRASWEIHRGPIPNGMYVLHRCDVRNCVNPGHLFLGTCTDNARDMHAKGRGRPPKGSSHSSAKLSEEAVKEIRALASLGAHTFSEIGHMYDVHESTISNVISGKSWKHVT